MFKKIRVGIIGCGNIAGLDEFDLYREKPCTHVGAYQTRKDIYIVGCCDIKLEQARLFAKKFDINFFTNSINELLKKKIDILSICVTFSYSSQALGMSCSTPSPAA